ncbi:MAG: DegT/DnrJ/EryC1/StrS family aminotransferase [Arhodomonas sp.]|nr:DegT/DnrJ/EryC1/StrS family aminotransferase [Arhodomonas sp.]
MSPASGAPLSGGPYAGGRGRGLHQPRHRAAHRRLPAHAHLLAARARHLTITAKAPHGYEFFHDELGFNYRMPNLNAALGCAQLDRLAHRLAAKREVARRYAAFFADRPELFLSERGA